VLLEPRLDLRFDRTLPRRLAHHDDADGRIGVGHRNQTEDEQDRAHPAIQLIASRVD